VNRLWDRFWLWLFRDIGPEPMAWVRFEMPLRALKRDLGECLAPSIERLMITITEEEG